MDKRMVKIRLLITVLILLICAGFCYAQEAAWVFPYSAARHMAQEEEKILLVAVVVDWDRSSRVLLNKTFKEKLIVGESEKFVLTQVGIIDKDFLEKYKIKQVPTIIFLKEVKGEWIEIDRLTADISQGVLLIEMRGVLANKNTYYALDKKRQAEPYNEKVLADLAQLCFQQKRTERAIELYEYLLRLGPDNRYRFELDYLEAVSDLEQGNFSAAKTKFEKFIKQYPKNKYETDARFYLINSCLALNQAEVAFKEITSFLNDFPRSKHSPLLIYTLAEYYFYNGFHKKGTGMFVELIKRYPDSFSAEQAQAALENLIAWPERRVEIRLRKKVSDVVFVVEDAETFLYYLSLWKKKEIFPILFSGSKLTEKFIEVFKPSQVIYPEPVKIGDIDEQVILRVLFASWGDEDIFNVGQVTKEQIKQRLMDGIGMPLGVVFTRPLDEEMAGGLALAAARGEILEFLPHSYKYGRTLNFEEKEHIRKQIRGLISDWKVLYEGILEGIDFITVACDLSYAYNYSRTPYAGRYCLDDAIDRDDDGQRYAFCGRLIGPRDKALYQAMCAIFLQPKKALFFNTYSTDVDLWNKYETKNASELLSGFIQSQTIEEEATLETWQALMKPASDYGLIFVNSSGGGYDWNTRSGTGTVDDIPETVPAVVYFTQSGSATDPKNTETIAGRWLEKGAYIYYGAITEPFVQAFNPPQVIINNLLFGHTYAWSFRKQEGAWSNPWRLIYIGDPMAYFGNVAIERVEYTD